MWLNWQPTMSLWERTRVQILQNTSLVRDKKLLSVTPNWEFSLITNSNYGGLKKIKIITISDINISKDCLKDFTLSLLVSLVKIALKGKIY